MVAMSAGTVDGTAPPGMTADYGTLAPRPRRKRRWLLGSVIFGGDSGTLSGQIINRQIDTFGGSSKLTGVPLPRDHYL
jgi:hypothetical protein